MSGVKASQRVDDLASAKSRRAALRSIATPESTDTLAALARRAGDQPRARVNTFLTALPIAAAVVVEGKHGLAVLTCNERFVTLDAQSTGAPEQLVEREPIVAGVTALFDDPETASHMFEWRDGDVVSGRHFQVHVSRLGEPDDRPRACMLTLVDRTAEIANARSLRTELLHDSLTGLPNRSAFAEAVEEVMSGGERDSYAVLLVDLARFSRVNESLGVMAGDEVIITVARRLISSLRAGDTLARVGGDEFGVLVKISGGTAEALTAARRIQQVLAAPFRLSHFEIGLESAIGCALPGSGEAIGGEEMVRNAQLALKRAKDTGRIEIHHSNEVACARYKLDIETELRRAIDQDQLTLAYQPIVDLAANRVVGFEALARWNHPVRGSIDPAEFIPVAEEAGMIVPLGRWAINAALGALSDWDRKAGMQVPLSMSVNVSAIQLARDDVPGMIAGSLAAHGMSGERLTIELTESSIVHDPERTTRALQALKALSVKIAMDDFGTGYSSLSYLRRLPIDLLKIDRSFVSGMLADRDKVAIVRAVLSLADALGKQTTAEGIETIELSQTLAALGCTHGQGYFYAKPLSADDAFDYWLSRKA